MARKKENGQEKVCLSCGRLFAWRKKWAANWDEVRYCSDACRTGRRAAARIALGKAVVAKSGA